jgi:hypothetical protein
VTVTDQVAEVERLVGELRATGAMSAEQIADVERFVADAKAGTLWADDFTYLIALHAKVTGAPASKASDTAMAAAADTKFAEIKRWFTDRFHPETGSATDVDPEIRARIYGDFLAEFDTDESAH